MQSRYFCAVRCKNGLEAYRTLFDENWIDLFSADPKSTGTAEGLGIPELDDDVPCDELLDVEEVMEIDLIPTTASSKSPSDRFARRGIPNFTHATTIQTNKYE
ncbi:hypothetical protein MD484_g3138, partial [Candolleomyces efflorescens]